jgi:histone H3/H4
MMTSPSFNTLDLPQANVMRVLKSALPQSVQISKDCKSSFQKAGGLFILYLTNQATQFAQQAKRSTVSGEDILAALEELEFDSLVEPAHQFLLQYRSKHSSSKKRKSEDFLAVQPTESAKSKTPRKSREEKQAEREERQAQQALAKTAPADEANENQPADEANKNQPPAAPEIQSEQPTAQDTSNNPNTEGTTNSMDQSEQL